MLPSSAQILGLVFGLSIKNCGHKSPAKRRRDYARFQQGVRQGRVRVYVGLPFNEREHLRAKSQDSRNTATFSLSEKRDGINQAKVLRALGRKCQRCRSIKQPLNIHHVKPFRLGGTNSLTNLTVLCTTCHREVHSDGTRAPPRDLSPQLKPGVTIE